MTILRSAAFNVFFFLFTAAMALYGLLLWAWAPQRLLSMTQTWACVLCRAARVVCGIRLVVVGEDNIPIAGAAIIASQHQSAFDTFVWLTLLPRPAYVVKQELVRIPAFGSLLRPAGMIVVDRHAGAAAVRQLLRDTTKACLEQRQIVIFPEGTRVAHGVEAALQPGVAAMAAHSRLPIVPAATDSGKRWGRRTFLKKPGPIHIVVGRPLPAGLRRDVLMSRLRAAWQEAAAQLELVDNSVG